MEFDPASKNIVFPDADAKNTYIGHLEFPATQLVEGPSIIPGVPYVDFSPDSLVLYALYSRKIGIYGFQPNAGALTANTSLPVQGKVTLAITTLTDHTD